MRAPFVAILALGGTIASKPGGGPFAEPRLTAEDLAALVGSSGGLPELRPESVAQVASGDLTFAVIAEVADRVRARVAEGAVGVVVTQGTDTLEETAYALDLLLDVEAPVVVTGALRNPSLPGADGAANLVAAIRVAASPAARGLGVVVAFADEIHAARFVRKTHAYRTSAFASPGAGPIGWVAEDRVRIALRPDAPTPTLAWRGEPPDVLLVTLSFSMSPAALAPWLQRPPAGFVLAAFGSGHAPSWMVESIGTLAAKIPVVLASRTGAGETFRQTYGYAGSETDLIARGCIPAGWIDPLKARVLLALLLGEGADRARVAEVFAGL